MHTEMNKHFVKAFDLKSGMRVVRCDVINAKPVTIRKKPVTDYIINDGKYVTTIETEYGKGVIYSSTEFELLDFDRQYL